MSSNSNYAFTDNIIKKNRLTDSSTNIQTFLNSIRNQNKNKHETPLIKGGKTITPLQNGRDNASILLKRSLFLPSDQVKIKNNSDKVRIAKIINAINKIQNNKLVQAQIQKNKISKDALMAIFKTDYEKDGEQMSELNEDVLNRIKNFIEVVPAETPQDIADREARELMIRERQERVAEENLQNNERAIAERAERDRVEGIEIERNRVNRERIERRRERLERAAAERQAETDEKQRRADIRQNWENRLPGIERAERERVERVERQRAERERRRERRREIEEIARPEIERVERERRNAVLERERLEMERVKRIRERKERYAAERQAETDEIQRSKDVRQGWENRVVEKYREKTEREEAERQKAADKEQEKKEREEAERQKAADKEQEKKEREEAERQKAADKEQEKKYREFYKKMREEEEAEEENKPISVSEYLNKSMPPPYSETLDKTSEDVKLSDLKNMSDIRPSQNHLFNHIKMNFDFRDTLKKKGVEEMASKKVINQKIVELIRNNPNFIFKGLTNAGYYSGKKLGSEKINFTGDGISIRPTDKMYRYPPMETPYFPKNFSGDGIDGDGIFDSILGIGKTILKKLLGVGKTILKNPENIMKVVSTGKKVYDAGKNVIGAAKEKNYDLTRKMGIIIPELLSTAKQVYDTGKDINDQTNKTAAEGNGLKKMRGGKISNEYPLLRTIKGTGHVKYYKLH